MLTCKFFQNCAPTSLLQSAGVVSYNTLPSFSAAASLEAMGAADMSGRAFMNPGLNLGASFVGVPAIMQQTSPFGW